MGFAAALGGVCQVCGAWVVDGEKHQTFHDAIATIGLKATNPTASDEDIAAAVAWAREHPDEVAEMVARAEQGRAADG
jgi:hypothetical protein